MQEKSFRRYVSKIKWGQEQTMPFMQGSAIKAVIAEYKLPAKRWGYWMDVIGVETNKQIMLWRDIGSSLTFLGILDKDVNTLQLPKTEPKQNKTFETYKELSDEIDKRNYQNIKGLKAKITEEKYMYFLEVLPPMGWKGNTFYMREFLSGDLTFKFTKVGNQFYCEVADFREERSDLIELEEAGMEV